MTKGGGRGERERGREKYKIYERNEGWATGWRCKFSSFEKRRDVSNSGREMRLK